MQTGAPYGGSVYCFVSTGTYLFAGTPSGVFLSTNNGSNWTSRSNGLSHSVSALIFSGTNIFAGSQGGVFKSTNNGASWTKINNGITTLNVITLAVSETNIFAGTYDFFSGGVFKSTNDGANWIPVNIGLSSSLIQSLAVCCTYLFAGTGSNGIYRSTNNGANWVTVNSGLTNYNVHTLAVSGTNLFAGTENGGVFLSTNNGLNWIAVNNGLSNLKIRVLRVSGTNIFAGTYSGVYLSKNNGANWVDKNQGFGIIPYVYSLIDANNYLFAGTNGQLVWRRLFTEIIGVQNISTEIPSLYSLNQNYPNPFNPTTTIKFAIASSPLIHSLSGTNVKISVFDISGREVETLVNEQLQAGTYQIQWYASAYSSGVYFYKILAGEFSETKRMLLIK